MDAVRELLGRVIAPGRRRIANRPRWPRAAPVRSAEMQLERDAQRLLWQLVGAARAVPRAQRGGFLAITTWGGNVLQHPGLPGGGIDGYDEGDLRDLMESGVVRVTQRGQHGDEQFELRLEAFELYDRAHRDLAAPVAAQENLVREHVTSDTFAARYRDAYDKWRDADVLLWRDRSVQDLTTIGHLCREALQLFVSRLIEMHGVSGADADPAKTVNRLHSVIDARRPQISTRNADLLGALVDYWKGVSGIVQRQEHGTQKAGDELTWNDGRRVLLYTAMVMAECDSTLS